MILTSVFCFGFVRRRFFDFLSVSLAFLILFLSCRCSEKVEGRGWFSWWSRCRAQFVGRVRMELRRSPEFSGLRRWPQKFFLSNSLHNLPLKRTFVLESLELLDQFGVFLFYFLFSFPRRFLGGWFRHNTLTKPMFLLHKAFTSRARILIGFSW